MSNLNNYTGQKFGRLECLYEASKIKGENYWTCRCDCGAEVDVRIYSLVSGRTKSCGCLRKAPKDYTGRKFGRLECLPDTMNIKGEIFWKCICDCGTFVDVKLKSLLDKSTTSCGCSKQEPVKKGRKLKDYTGQKFGRLECISQSSTLRVKGRTFWKCKCDCGKILDVNIGNVVSGGTKSCGCLK